MSFTSVDLPEPDTPVTTVITPSGKLTSICCRLFSRAPRIVIALPLVCRRANRYITCFWPEMYCPVSERGKFSISSGVPLATTSPPCRPAPGPRSMT